MCRCGRTDCPLHYSAPSERVERTQGRSFHCCEGDGGETELLPEVSPTCFGCCWGCQSSPSRALARTSAISWLKHFLAVSAPSPKAVLEKGKSSVNQDFDPLLASFPDHLWSLPDSICPFSQEFSKPVHHQEFPFCTKYYSKYFLVTLYSVPPPTALIITAFPWSAIQKSKWELCLWLCPVSQLIRWT